MRDIPVGNGSLLVNFDDKYQIRDFYFPHVGQENHSEGFPFRFGVWVNGEFAWVDADEWTRKIKYVANSSITDVTLANPRLGLDLRCNDTVAERENIFLRRVVVRETAGRAKEIRIFLHHDFRIYENKVGDTAFYDPDSHALIHYKKHRYFLIDTEPHFHQFATGRKAFRNQEGTWRDAEDGHLYGGAITEGSVDSTIAVHAVLEANGEFEFHYWIAAGMSHSEVRALNQTVLDRKTDSFFSDGSQHSRDWLDKAKIDLSHLPASVATLYSRSLLIIRTQIDSAGAIIAANDHDVTERATDHYSYLWTRDGAFVANALDRAGYADITRRFFQFCQTIVHERGYFLQKYNPDGTVGSGWHAHWDKVNNREMVPIQEDETALVLWALWEHCLLHRDEEFRRGLYDSLIVKCADFLVDFRNPGSGLPLPSWNLWEDSRGIHTFTCTTVAAGLRAAAKFAVRHGDSEKARKYDLAADEIVEGMKQYLYSESLGRFLRGLVVHADEKMEPDPTVDASLFGLFYFGCFDPDDPMVVSTMAAVETVLRNINDLGGIGRFENDGYMRGAHPAPGNPWFICTLWLAEYYIARANLPDDLKPALEILEWTTRHAMPSGVLAEQIDPVTGSPLSVSPLTWSHSTFVATVHSYLDKLADLSPNRTAAVKSPQ